ncbi:E3 ubiquitin-protein ligase RNF10-like [Liolophura sinensis]|uniref:E3 ubiquitin-protein ligase RNF10-like n=1 Tax=Liolophura sinensis TaxID=3198878 RepID=UPI0031585335
MIEEETSAEMDRKNSSRTSSVPPKSNGCQEPKKSENGNGGRFTRHKKREPTVARPRQDNGVVRKPTPQKSRASTDKRPRSRGLFGDRQREEVSPGEERVEYGTALQKGSRKGNLNHLLNFTYAPRDTGDGVSGQGRSSHGRWPRRGHYKTKYNKEQFLQANCQFIVREGEDYSVHSADPDKLVDWDLVEQVRVCSSELPSCPICLYPPVAAKITRCGHIYCSACMLHYLALGEKNWRKCPICYEAIHKGHLKSVQTKCAHSYKVGEEITFQLMKKEKGSTMALPKSYWTQRGGKPLSLNDELVSLTTSLVVATEEEVRQLIIEPERRALEKQLSADTEESETCFIESALALLKERVDELKGNRMIKEEVKKTLQPVLEFKDSDEATPVTSPKKGILNESIVQYSDAFLDEEAVKQEAEVTGELHQGEETSGSETVVQETEENGNNDETPGTSPNLVAEGSPEVTMLSGEQSLPVEEALEYLAVEEEAKPEERRSGNTFYYFYQAKDGQHIYIHAVNARCLVREYGSLENCPETLTATVVEIESVFMTEELRRRLRYLCHLPLTCEFQVAEVLLKPPVVSRDTLNCFAGEIERRQRLRQKKTRDERKHTKKIEAQEKLKHGFYPELRIPLNSSAQFPTTTGERELGSSSPSSTSSHSTPVTSPTSAKGLNVFASEFVPVGGGTSSSSPASWGRDSGTRSFATMLKEGKAMPKVWPKSNTSADSTVRPGVEKPIQRRLDSDESDPEDKVPVPEFHSAFEDAIQQAFDNLSKSKGVLTETEKAIDNGPGRKKKKQKKLLFTTTMTRGK